MKHHLRTLHGFAPPNLESHLSLRRHWDPSLALAAARTEVAGYALFCALVDTQPVTPVPMIAPVASMPAHFLVLVAAEGLGAGLGFIFTDSLRALLWNLRRRNRRLESHLQSWRRSSLRASVGFLSAGYAKGRGKQRKTGPPSPFRAAGKAFIQPGYCVLGASVAASDVLLNKSFKFQVGHRRCGGPLTSAVLVRHFNAEPTGLSARSLDLSSSPQSPCCLPRRGGMPEGQA